VYAEHWHDCDFEHASYLVREGEPWAFAGLCCRGCNWN